MNDLKLSLVMKFVDQFTGPLRRAKREIDDAGQDVVRAEERRARQFAAIGRGGMVVGAAIAGGMAAAVKAAVDFETAMANVSKYGLIEDAAEIEKLKDDILALSTEIPLAATEIAAIVAAASQADVVDLMLPDAEQRDQVLAFAKEVGEIAKAFETSTEAATEFYVGLINRAGLSLAEAGLVADAINHLDNNMAAASSDLMKMMVEVGGVGAAAGLTQVQVAALSTAFVGSASNASIAGTSLKNFLYALSSGESATDPQIEAFERLGLSATETAEAMQRDAEGTIIDVLQRVAALDDVDVLPTIGTLVGREAAPELATLVNNVEAIPKAFALVAEEAQYAGSAAAEFERTLDSTAVKWKLVQNAIFRIGVIVGDKLLPPIKTLLDGTISILEKITAWGEEAGNVERAVLGVTAALGFLGVVAMFNPVVAAIGLISAAVLLLIKHWDDLKAAFQSFFDWVEEAARATGEVIADALTFELPDWGHRTSPSSPPGPDGAAPAAPTSRGEVPVGPGPRRATGGGVRAGQTYQWQEEGLELFAPMTDGRVISNSELKRIGRGGGRGDTINVGDIHVHAAPGMSAVEVARAVRRELTQAMRPRAPLHDGGVYG